MPDNTNEAIDAFAIGLVQNLEPAEAQDSDLVQTVSEEFWINPSAFQEFNPTDKKHGAAVVISLAFTTIALSVCKQIFDYIVDEHKKVLLNESQELIKKKVADLFRKSSNQTPPGQEAVKLSSAQLRAVKDKALASGRKLGLNEAKAEQLADSIISRLALE